MSQAFRQSGKLSLILTHIRLRKGERNNCILYPLPFSILRHFKFLQHTKLYLFSEKMS